jgi:hypothetical protein
MDVLRKAVAEVGSRLVLWARPRCPTCHESREPGVSVVCQGCGDTVMFR